MSTRTLLLYLVYYLLKLNGVGKICVKSIQREVE